MTIQQFQQYHSELIEYCQCIEYDIKRIYSDMSSDDFDDNMDMLGTSNLGTTIARLRKLDYSDGDPWLTEAEYEQLDRIRQVRNYWCHQCYIDYVYIDNDYQREIAFQRIANRLSNEHNRVYNLHRKLEELYLDWFGD